MFENEFMDIQRDLINLCIEFSQGKADNIFAFIFQREDEFYFNSVFKIGKEYLTIRDLEYPIEVENDFMELATDIIKLFPAVFDNYNREKPIQYKLIFNVKTKKLKFELEYSKDIDTSKPCDSVFDEWKKKLSKKSFFLF